MPTNSVSEATAAVARSRQSGGIMVGDAGDGVGGLGEGINLPPTPGKTGSNLELLSDPQGVDFRPYLVQVLARVRKNWFPIIPESARMGLHRGRVLVQFAIDRSGTVPKLVISMPSGSQPLDRAAVAGISASNPFPPLPALFKGEQIRLQLTFSYNMSQR
jgi:TonB family protein